MNWNYDEFAEKLAMGRIDVDGAAMPFVLDEARKRRDGNVIAHVASWYEDVKDDKARYWNWRKSRQRKGLVLRGRSWLRCSLLAGRAPYRWE